MSRARRGVPCGRPRTAAGQTRRGVPRGRPRTAAGQTRRGIPRGRPRTAAGQTRRGVPCGRPRTAYSATTRVVPTLKASFHDAHIHLLAYAASLDAIDCRPPAVSSIAAILRAIAARASRTPPGEWLMATGYDHAALPERRHPTRQDLDRAAPRHPVRLDHVSGHAAALNTLALRRVGIGDDTDEPPGATIARDLETGAPNGVLFEMSAWLNGRIPRPSRARLAESLGRAFERLASYGVASVEDATHTNDLERWELFQDLIARLDERGCAIPSVTLMPGAASVRDFASNGLTFGARDGNLSVGRAKIMVTASSGAMNPSPAELREIVAECVSLGFPVAIHAVEAEVVRAAASAIAANPIHHQGPAGVARHRIEHCAECPPDVLDAVVQSGASVATQPAFIRERGDAYLRDVPPDMLPHLYPIASLMKRDVPVVFSSDAPVAEPDPVAAIEAATTRQTATGRTVAYHERISRTAAIRAYAAKGK